MSITSTGKNSGLKLAMGLKANTLKPLSLILVSGTTSRSPKSGSPISSCQSMGILIMLLPIFSTSAGLLKLSKKINGIKK
jgi:hypothetical protein